MFDLPDRLIEVTEHQASVYCCAACGGETKAAFPAGVASPAQYGERVRAAAVYLNVHQLIPEDRVAEAMGDLFGALRLCSQSVADWVRGKAAALAPVAAQIAALAAQAPVRCLDETGFRVAGKGQWLHTVATETLTHYRVSAKRGEMPEGLTGGVAVHDGFKSYSGLTDVRHALCNAHHLRELKALVEIDREPWAAPMRDLLLEANRAVENAREAGATSLPPPALEGFFTRYWEILRQGLAFHRNLPRLQRHPSNRGRTKHRPDTTCSSDCTSSKTTSCASSSTSPSPSPKPGRTGPAHDEGKMKISGAFRFGICEFASKLLESLRLFGRDGIGIANNERIRCFFRCSQGMALAALFWTARGFAEFAEGVDRHCSERRTAAAPLDCFNPPRTRRPTAPAAPRARRRARARR